MITLTIGGQQKDVTGGWMTLPRVGVWMAQLTASGDQIPSGKLTVTLAGVEMPAFIQRANLVEGMLDLRVVGGGGGMGKPPRAKHYRNPTARHVLEDLLRDAGETLGSASSSAALGTSLPYWTTLGAGPTGQPTTGAMVQLLCDVVGSGCAWRVDWDGTVRFGQETWPACPADTRIISQSAANASQVVGSDVMGIWPGTTLAGRRIDFVRHDFDGQARSTIIFAEGHA